MACKPGDAVRFDARGLGAAAPVTFVLPPDARPGALVSRKLTAYGE